MHPLQLTPSRLLCANCYLYGLIALSSFIITHNINLHMFINNIGDHMIALECSSLDAPHQQAIVPLIQLP
jgi:hypothetical protein